MAEVELVQIINLFPGFQLEYLNIVCQIECYNQQPEKFICHISVQHFLSAGTYLCLIAALFFYK